MADLPHPRPDSSSPATPPAGIALSREVKAIRTQAESVARGTQRQCNSVHYLIGTLLVECPARELLLEAGIDEATALDTYERLEDRLDERPSDREDGAEVLKEIHRLAEGLAENVGSREVTSTVLLASMLRVRNALAAKVLDAAGVNVPGLRAKLIGHVTLANDRAGITGQRQVPRQFDTGLQTSQSNSRLELRAPEPPRPVDLTQSRRLQLPMQAPIEHLLRERDPPRPVVAPRPNPPPHQAEQQRLPDMTRSAEQPAVVPPQNPTPRHVEPVIVPEPPRPAPKPLHRGVFVVDAAHFPTLHEIGRNLTQAALNGEIDPIFGRDGIIDAVIDVLLMKQVNNPCLIGEAGVGKTAVVEGLALRLAGNVAQYGRLGSAVIMEIQTSSLLAGTALRGAFSERMRKLRDEVAKAEGQILVFMDEIHTIMGAKVQWIPLAAASVAAILADN